MQEKQKEYATAHFQVCVATKTSLSGQSFPTLCRDSGFLCRNKFCLGRAILGRYKGFLGRNIVSWLYVTWFSLCRDIVSIFKP